MLRRGMLYDKDNSFSPLLRQLILSLFFRSPPGQHQDHIQVDAVVLLIQPVGQCQNRAVVLTATTIPVSTSPPGTGLI